MGIVSGACFVLEISVSSSSEAEMKSSGVLDGNGQWAVRGAASWRRGLQRARSAAHVVELLRLVDAKPARGLLPPALCPLESSDTGHDQILSDSFSSKGAQGRPLAEPSCGSWSYSRPALATVGV